MASKYGNKIHIYSLNDYQIKHCFIFGESELHINSCVFDIKGKYISFFVNLSEILMINIGKDDNYICQCKDFNDVNIQLISSRLSVISRFFSNIKV